MNAIFQRRSIRKYEDKPVPDKAVRQILRAGMAAPSAGNAQEWEFILCRDKEKMAKIMEMHEYAFALKTAPLAVLVCGNAQREVYPGEDWWVQDCAAATQNMLVEAADLGIGSLWLGIHPIEKRIRMMREIFRLPEHIHPFSLVALGYASKEKEPIDRYEPGWVHEEQF